MSLARVGVPVPIDPLYDRWDVTSNGTIVVGHPTGTGRGTLTAHLPDGRVVTMGTGHVAGRDRLLLDDVSGVVTWGSGQAAIHDVLPSPEAGSIQRTFPQ